MFIRFDYKDMPVPLDRAIEELKKRGGTLFENRPTDFNCLCLSNGQILFSNKNISDDVTEIFYDKFGDYFYEGKKLQIEPTEEIVDLKGRGTDSNIIIVREKLIFTAKRGDCISDYAEVFNFTRIKVNEVYGYAIRNDKYEEVRVGFTSQAYRPASKSEKEGFKRQLAEIGYNENGEEKPSWKPKVGDIFYLPHFIYSGFTAIKATYQEGYNFISDNGLAFPTEKECQKFCEYLNKKFKAAINEY